MSRSYVPRALRARVAAQARYRCGYCLLSERLFGIPLEIEHIIPEALGGPTTEDNLWLACSACNGRKGDRVAARDPMTGDVVPLFDPRHQVWHEHFAWTPAGDWLVGQTPPGRATIRLLALNRPELVAARRLWVAAGWHPPAD